MKISYLSLGFRAADVLAEKDLKEKIWKVLSEAWVYAEQDLGISNEDMLAISKLVLKTIENHHNEKFLEQLIEKANKVESNTTTVLRT